MLFIPLLSLNDKMFLHTIKPIYLPFLKISIDINFNKKKKISIKKSTWTKKRGGGLVKNPRLSTRGGGGFKKCLEFVHVVYGRPFTEWLINFATLRNLNNFLFSVWNSFFFYSC